MDHKYRPVLDDIENNKSNITYLNEREDPSKNKIKYNYEDRRTEELSLNNIYGKIVKIRKELEKSYNLYYSYNLIVNNNDTEKDIDTSLNSYNNINRRNDIINSTTNSSVNNLTLNKINALTNSFYMNIGTLKNAYAFINSNNMNNSIINNENVIWEKRIETLTNESNVYIKTLDSIYKNNLKQSEQNKKKNMNSTYENNKKKRKNTLSNESAIGYLHKEKEILKQIEDSLNVFYTQGVNTLNNLRRQNKFLKGVRKKVIDISNYIGLSMSLVDMIKKTHKQNLIIVIVGMILVLLFFYVLYSYFK
ncbi:SNARE protein, putative [Hepatocystis sp. ex Piliocolobus tephrosceles]|nr:SNARE protein, putative [Hepatocystis sp. ex Piliocolobus tephrosceles]